MVPRPYAILPCDFFVAYSCSLVGMMDHLLRTFISILGADGAGGYNQCGYLVALAYVTIHNTNALRYFTPEVCVCVCVYGARCWWRSWLRHCATSRKVAGSIPDGVIGIFHWHNPSGRTMALGSTQPLTEMSTRNISWGVKAAGA